MSHLFNILPSTVVTILGYRIYSFISNKHFTIFVNRINYQNCMCLNKRK